MRIVVFGVGNFYRENKNKISNDDNVIAFLDNNALLWGKMNEGVVIYEPSHISLLQYDAVILMSIYADEIRNQLLGLGVRKDKIWLLNKYLRIKQRGILRLYCCNSEIRNCKKRILIVSTYLDYNGGTLAAVYAAKALLAKGFAAVLAAPLGNQRFIEEASKEVDIVICPAICYIGEEEKYWISQFDVVLVNVFQMLPCACEISVFRPVLWWIHEPSILYCGIYEKIRTEFLEYDDVSTMHDINIAAVSRIAKRNFEEYYPGRVDAVLPYGIPDMVSFYRKNDYKETDSGKKLTAAIIGLICERKAQKIFVEAVLHMTKEERENMDFLIIGQDVGDAYCDEVKKLAENVPQIKITGQLTRKQMNDIYKKVDIIVCASMEETMSITITEGMMYGKICITTDKTGMAEYITDKENGFICRSGDVDSLYEKMKWIMDNKDVMDDIKKNSRMTYERFFTMESFGNRLEKMLLQTEEKYWHQKV